MKSMALHRGFILPFVVILSLVIMSSISTWYRQIVLQSFLSERLIYQRAAFNECKSLLPILKERVEQIPVENLQQEDKEFLHVDEEGNQRWMIARSAVFEEKLVFTFEPSKHYTESIRLTIGFPGK